MQYLVAIAWVTFIVHELRRAHTNHCVTKTLQEIWQRLSQIEPGMAADRVKALLGGPARITAAAGAIVWQYRIDNQFKSVTFAGGKVVQCDRPPAQAAGEL